MSSRRSLRAGSKRESAYSSFAAVGSVLRGNRGGGGWRVSFNDLLVRAPRSSRLLIVSMLWDGREACARRRGISSKTIPSR